MARRRTKKRTQLHGQNDSANSKNAASQSPKSMVIRIGASEVGSSVSQLAKDFRLMMEPDTASRLKERRANKLKDYVVMAGPLGVTHLILFSKSSTGNTNMRLALTPRGPTLHFKVENYSLCKDVAKALKHPRGGGQDHRTPPLLVMNNFNTPDADEDSKIPKRLESLATTVFQSLFPPINPQATPLTSIRRVMMLNREKVPNDDAYILKLRHYAITTRKTGVSKRIRRLDPTLQRHKDPKKSLPNLGKLEDVADYLLDPAAGGYTSASETELDTDAEVEITESTTKKVLSRREMQRLKAGEKSATNKQSVKPNVEKRAVKLVELGPRMTLRLKKVEEGLCGGRIMWHDFISKSEKEVKKMDDEWNRRRKEKEERKKQQRANIEKKKQDKAKAKANGQGGDNADDDDEDVSMDDDYEWDSDEYDGEAGVEEDSEGDNGSDDDEFMEE
ncbi:ribosome biogenesis protein Ssf2, putative [Talaromyces stipitatus ATCC 10500]|uniref:Ribosome biogenesis protein Ssf2, putative n=1 Tax=Talaromyces stipitatus (strain ATCC 10500 / CBS 375.48 / QM 6759 / NRRL 1006) TaxID=441959 RepID=B8M6P1_TALSN|nr:ribosome biogenesis protein Ssf2, putative [Talaromyces stipitatus ATCC 10500]EED19503.1 ribosome biogenesis protein Ssf2, putative [Talaromyces stipitatus ATCC 10500]